ncbi:MAG TPA: ABC transporter permease [Vicinamibacterales bacterium]|nr:ABC transporter permease [Vicinamibacterales bacterium]
MDTLLQDIRYALRVMRANPLLVGAAVVSLAIGIGPNAAVFSVIEALGFRPLPIEDPASLLRISSTVRAGDDDGLSYPEYLEVRDATRSLGGIAVSAPQALGMRIADGPAVVTLAATASANYFQTLGIEPVIGRAFLPEEDRTPGTHPVALLSHRIWVRRFEADPSVLGRTVRLNRIDCTVIGVLPAGFEGTQPILAPEVWVPTMLWPALSGGEAATLTERRRREMTVVARLAEGATLAEARGELDALGARLAESYPATNAGRRLTVDYDQSIRRRPAALFGGLALAVVSLILLIACANVAGLLLGRSEARRDEIALRLAMGASRVRLVRQLLTESLVLSLIAAGAGTLAALGLVRTVPLLIPALPMTLNFDFRLDLRVLAFTLLVALVAAPAFGLLPALLASRTDLAPILKGAPAGGRRGRRVGVRHVLVVSQIAVALVLLVSSGLFTRSYLAARGMDPGFETRPMLFCTMSPGIIGYDETGTRNFYDDLLARLSAVPGIERATLVRHVPLNTMYGGGAMQEVTVTGQQPPPGQDAWRIRYNVIGAGYFETMGIPLVAGRDFDGRDHRSSPCTVLVNQTMATRFWSGGEALGQHVALAPVGNRAAPRDCQVAGIVRDGKYLRLGEDPEPYLYLAFDQQFSGEMTVVARTRGDAGRLAAAFRREVQAIEPAMPTLRVVTLDEHMRLALIVERVLGSFMAVLGGLGLLLSVVGLYGVVSYLVARRTREIGVRVAIGASPRRVVAEIVRDGAGLTAVGVAIGTLLALASLRLTRSLLNGVSPSDPLVYAAAIAVVVAVALLATYVPARRAARVDPVKALRTT